MNFKIIILTILVLTIVKTNANDNYEQELIRNRTILERLKSEIDQIQEQITRAQIDESNINDQIILIDKEVSLISQTKGLLERERRLIAAQIESSNLELKKSEERIKKLKELYAERAIYAYKYGRVRNLQLLLSSQSFNQALIRYKYLKMIAEHDQRTIRSIEDKKLEIKSLKQKLDRDFSLKNKNLLEKQKEENNYLSSRSKKTSLLKDLRWTQNTYQAQLTRKKQEREKLATLIVELEKKRRLEEQSGEQTEYVNFDFDDITKARGKLPWPVKGKVITKYGKQRDPGSKTFINNTDIEIQSALGTQVKAIFTGVVRIITYLPGYGNTVIIDHGKGYYTVYSHLDEIYIQKDDFVKTSEVIATVGDSGSFSGSKLQFGIYGSQKSYNPEEWLQ